MCDYDQFIYFGSIRIRACLNRKSLYILGGMRANYFRKITKSASNRIALGSFCFVLALIGLASCSSKKADFESHKKSGLKSVISKEYPQAIASLKNALKLKPSDREAMYFIAVSFENMGELDSAISYTRKIIALHKPDEENCLMLGRLATAAKEWDYAIDALNGLIMAGVNTPDELFDEFFQVYMAAGLLVQASSVSDTLIKLYPDSSGLYVRSANVKGLLGEYDKAILILEEAIRRFGPSTNVYTNLGAIHSSQRNHQRAEIFYRRALELDSSNSGAWMNLGHSLSIQKLSGKKREAIECYNRVNPELFFTTRLDTIISRLENEVGGR